MSKTSQIKSQDQKLVPFEKEYLPSDWTSNAKIWTAYFQKGFCHNLNFGQVIKCWKMFHIWYWDYFIYLKGVHPPNVMSPIIL